MKYNNTFIIASRAYFQHAKCTGSVTVPKGCHLYGFGDRPQGSLSGITASCIMQGREEITVALVASWGALCLHTAPNGY